MLGRHWFLFVSEIGPEYFLALVPKRPRVVSPGFELGWQGSYPSALPSWYHLRIRGKSLVATMSSNPGEATLVLAHSGPIPMVRLARAKNKNK